MIYVASPYSHPAAEVREHRYQFVRDFVHHCLINKHVVFSPIVYLHELAKLKELPKDANYWKGFNNNILRRCEIMFVVKMIGWEQSHGVQQEISLAQELQMPIVWIDIKNEKFPEGFSL